MKSINEKFLKYMRNPRPPRQIIQPGPMPTPAPRPITQPGPERDSGDKVSRGDRVSRGDKKDRVPPPTTIKGGPVGEPRISVGVPGTPTYKESGPVGEPRISVGVPGTPTYKESGSLGMKKGGAVKGSKTSKRGDGIAKRGKTKGRMV